jgi:hypothetical protein
VFFFIILARLVHALRLSVGELRMSPVGFCLVDAGSIPIWLNSTVQG